LHLLIGIKPVIDLQEPVITLPFNTGLEENGVGEMVPVQLACPACKKRISSSAHSCSQCGEPPSDEWEEKGRLRRRFRGAFIIVGLAAIVVAIQTLSDGPKLVQGGVPTLEAGRAEISASLGELFIPLSIGSLVAGITFFALSKFRFRKTQIPVTRVNAQPVSTLYRFNKLGRHKALPAIMVLVCALWIAWPYYAVYALAIALRDGDSVALEGSVAWDSVRQGLRGDLNAMLLQRVGGDSGPFSGLTAVLGPAVINQMIDSYITPQGVATLMRSEKSRATDAASAAGNNAAVTGEALRIDISRLNYAFFSGGPLTFKVEFQNENKDRSPFIWLFKWSGAWKLTRIIIPADAVADGPNTRVSGAAGNARTGTTTKGEPPPIQVRLINKGFKNSDPRNSDFEDDITFSLSIDNLTDKDIRAFDGTLIFTDLLDNVVLSSSLAINEMVRTGSTLTWSGRIKYNQFIDTHQRLRNVAFANLKINFNPKKLLFVDGSTKNYSR
jgi:hypothetical protein